jgi:hypothetical protein
MAIDKIQVICKQRLSKPKGRLTNTAGEMMEMAAWHNYTTVGSISQQSIDMTPNEKQ